jgi:hypothetical protein
MSGAPDPHEVASFLPGGKRLDPAARREARPGMSGPAVLSTPGAISSDRDYG